MQHRGESHVGFAGSMEASMHDGCRTEPRNSQTLHLMTWASSLPNSPGPAHLQRHTPGLSLAGHAWERGEFPTNATLELQGVPHHQSTGAFSVLRTALAGRRDFRARLSGQTLSWRGLFYAASRRCHDCSSHLVGQSMVSAHPAPPPPGAIDPAVPCVLLSVTLGCVPCTHPQHCPSRSLPGISTIPAAWIPKACNIS